MADAERCDYRDDILPKEQSVVDLVRVAAYINQIPAALDMVKDAHDKGYETTVNLMAVSTVAERELDEALELLAESETGAIYLVDSFGALYSEQVQYLVRKYLHYAKPAGKEVGIHAHNNLQLAFANTIEAIILGANMVDATMAGLGRGAGNCPMELLIGFLHNPKYRLRPVLRCVQEHVEPLRDKLGWGFDLPYMITGLLNQHPRAAIKFNADASQRRHHPDSTIHSRNPDMLISSLPQSRRTFLRLSGASALAALVIPRALGADAESGSRARRMTISLAPGSIGIQADQLQAIELAHRHGFESVEPYGGHLARLSSAELESLLGDLKDKRLVWGAAGLPVDFRGAEDRFQSGLKELPGIAAGLHRAGVDRVGTWLTPAHDELTYLRNFRQHTERLREIALVLKDHGARLGLEYVGPATSRLRRRYGFVHTLAEALRVDGRDRHRQRRGGPRQLALVYGARHGGGTAGPSPGGRHFGGPQRCPVGIRHRTADRQPPGASGGHGCDSSPEGVP